MPDRYLSDHFEFAAPGDQQHDVWLIRFDDTERRDAIYTGEDAEDQAWAAWNQYAPSYNMRVFRLARLKPRDRSALQSIASVKRGLQGVYEDYSDVNARNYHEMVYWRDLAQRYQEIARAALETDCD